MPNPSLAAKADDVLADESDITYETISKLTYTQMVVKEVLRLYPPAPVTARTTTQPLEING